MFVLRSTLTFTERGLCEWSDSDMKRFWYLIFSFDLLPIWRTKSLYFFKRNVILHKYYTAKMQFTLYNIFFYFFAHSLCIACFFLLFLLYCFFTLFCLLCYFNKYPAHRSTSLPACLMPCTLHYWIMNPDFKLVLVALSFGVYLHRFLNYSKHVKHIYF